MKRTLVLTLLLALVATGARPATVSAAALPQLGGVDAAEISTSYSYLTENFYKHVNAQAVLDSVRATLLGAMRTAGLKAAALPPVHAPEPLRPSARSTAKSKPRHRNRSTSSTIHDLSYVALDGMMRSVNDRYTVFMTPKEFAGLNQGLDGGDFGGTGIVIGVDDKTKYIAVQNVIPNGPADKAGVEQDDLITTIDGNSTKGMSLDVASSKLRGKEGTHVTLTISRDGAPLRRRSRSRARRFTSSASTRRCSPAKSATSPSRCLAAIRATNSIRR